MIMEQYGREFIDDDQCVDVVDADCIDPETLIDLEWKAVEARFREERKDMQRLAALVHR